MEINALEIIKSDRAKCNFSLKLVSGLFVCFSALFASGYIHAQFSFQNTYSAGDRSGIAYDVTPSVDGGFVMSGFVETDTADNDVCVIKTDSSGNVIWQTSVSDSGRELGRAVIEDASKNVFVTGYGNSSGNYDIQIYKFDPNGNLLWKSVLGNESDDNGWHLCFSPDSSALLVFAYSSSLSPGTTAAMIIGINPDTGDTLFTNKYGEDLREFAHYILDTGDGYLCCGHTTSFSDSSDPDPNDCYVFKVDYSFNPMWGRAYGLNGREEGNAIAKCADGNYVLCGVTSSYGGDKDIFVMKIDPDGYPVWTKLIGENEDDDALDITVSSSGAIYVTGITYSYSATRDMFVYELDELGEIINAVIIDGGGREAAYGVCSSQDGSAVVSGYSQSYGFGASDIYLSKLDFEDEDNCIGFQIEPSMIPITFNTFDGMFTSKDSIGFYNDSASETPLELCQKTVCSSVRIDEKEQPEYSLYPNPAEHSVKISSSIMEPAVEFEIYDFLGRRVKEGNCFHHHNGEYRIDISDLSIGLYDLVLTTNSDSQVNLKFVKH